MKYRDLYLDCKKSVNDTLISMWRTTCDPRYSDDLNDAVNKAFAPSNAMPLVEDMSPYQTVDENSDYNFISPLWKSKNDNNQWVDKSYRPYQHQFDSWDKLLNKNRSIVVTTGTGSGKTECFMVPLVKDLLNHDDYPRGINAIFLYPLNALMEDQKKRINELLELAKDEGGKDMHFAVYNGNLPEDYPPIDNMNDSAYRRKINRISRDNQDAEQNSFPQIIRNRKEMRENPPEILLTNPTMLEYMLLRNSDQVFFPHADEEGNRPKGSLRWIVIDETHTYTGAGATELAMLIRRVLQAFNVSASDVRFVTSSATIGNANDNDEQKQENEQKLKQFIADISGKMPEDIDVISGGRVVSTPSNDERVNRCREIFDEHNNIFVPLDEIIHEGDTIEDKLGILDDLCALDSENQLKAKVHFFFQILNRGLRTKLDDDFSETGKFKIYTEEKVNDTIPYLELKYCTQCGHLIAVGEKDESGISENQYKACPASESRDFFDDDENKKKLLYFGLKKIEKDKPEDNLTIKENENSYDSIPEIPDKWQVVSNAECKCPYCGASLKKNKDAEAETDVEEDTDMIKTFRTSAKFISQIIAPSLLKQVSAHANADHLFHNGQHYLTFVDSRQAASRSTLSQNKEQEKLWMYSKIFHSLCEDTSTLAKRLKKLGGIQDNDDLLDLGRDIEKNIITEEQAIRQLNEWNIPIPRFSLSWQGIFKRLSDDPISEKFCELFIDKTLDSEDYGENGHIKSQIKNTYILSAMYCYLSKHPRKAASPETMGLFTSYFPKLENITTVPQGVLGIFGDKINVTGWKSLLKYFLDYTVRSNQSFCYSNNEINNISELKRFNTTKRLKANGKRRSVKKPEISEGEKGSKPACAWLLATLYDGNPSDNMNSHREEINTALDCLWNELTSRGLITQKIGDDDAEEGWYLNLDDLSFTLYDDVYFTNFATKGQAEAYRPTDTIFNGYTYVDVINRKPYKPTCTESHWSVFNSADAEQGGLAKWAQENRPYFWNNGLWGENGMFANRLNTIYNKPNLFIQAEHTAQVDKAVAKQTQKDFENGKINVLACSTTMEMGVDIGELELVVMNSVPPQPSNYKQRSGRSGRGIEYKPSASVTLCGSDAIGLRVMRHPMKEIIDREMAVPFVDWNCTKVIQRHLNAFLLRCALPIIQHDRQNPIMEKVIDFFTPFHQGENVAEIYHHDNNQNIVRVSAESGLGWGEDNAVSEEDEQIAAVNFINKLDDEKREENWKEIIQSLLKRTSLLEGDTLSPDVYSALINNTLDKLNDCIDILRDRMDYLKTKMQKATVDDHNVDNFQQLYNFFREHPRNADKKSISHLNYSYAAILNESLLEFLAKNRFSPNANMPVDIIEFDVNNNNSKRKWERNVSSNPSYPLREALMQYAPGNSVVLDNKNYIVAGIRSTGKYRNLYRNLCVYKHSNDKHSNEVIVEEFLKKDEQEKSDLKPLFEKAYNTDLVVPYSFCPDCNVSEDRSDASFVYSEVQAYLIGATDFNTSDLHLFSTRSSDEEKDAKILYINVGKGYGYCICKKCGRAAIEDSIKCVGASNEDRKIRRLPNDFYYYDEKTKKYLKQHNDVIKGGRCDYNKRYDIRRNAVIGSLIQTDFCEISLRDQFNNQLNDKDVITTLAIVFTKVFIGYIGKEERDVDFTVMPNNNICIFDTNPGGSGYSNKLDDAGTMKKIVDLSIELLNDIKSKDELLSQHTLKYIDKLNVKGAKTWLNREKEKSSSLLGEIREIYPNASVAYFNEIRNAIKNNSKETISLFFDDDFEKWNYEENGWRQLDLVKYQNVNNRWNTYIIGTKEILPPTLSVMFRMSNWCTLHRLQRLPLNDGTLYPIAIIGHDVFFTKDYTAIHMGNDWGHGTLYRTTIEDLQMDSQKIELNINNQNTILFMLNDTNSSRIQTTELGNLIYNNAQDIMNRFFEHCRNHTEERIHISYQDEHLKSMYSILLTLQTIEFFVGKFTNKFSLEFLNEIYFDSSNSNSFTSNFPTSYRRDEYLRKKANNWINKFNGTGTLQDIKSKDSKSLSHWRALTLTCAGKKLSIYPDGGFANGWKLGKNNDRFNENTDTTAIINVNRIAEIKYDVDLRDIDN